MPEISNSYFVSTWSTLSNANGNYSDYLKDSNGLIYEQEIPIADPRYTILEVKLITEERFLRR